MPTDIRLTTDRDIELDPTGDIATVTDAENVEQQHANAVFRAAAAQSFELLDADAEADFELAVRSELRSIPAVTSIHRLEVTARDGDSLEAVIETDATTDPVRQEVIV